MPFIPWLITRIFWIWLILTLCSGPSDHKPQTRREAIARPAGHGDHTTPADSELRDRLGIHENSTSRPEYFVPTNPDRRDPLSIIPKARGRTLVAAAAAQQI